MIGNALFNRVTQFKDLGVTFDTSLYFNIHIETIRSGAYKLLGFILRNTRDFRNSMCLKILHNAFVRSKLDYCCIVWCPYYVYYISSLESIQRKFCEYLYFIDHGTYPVQNYCDDRLLEEYKVTSSQSRREYIILSLLFKTIHSIYNNPSSLSYIPINVPGKRVRQSHTFRLQISQSNQHKHSPMYQMCHIYNRIQDVIDIFDSQTYNTNLKNIYLYK